MPNLPQTENSSAYLCNNNSGHYILPTMAKICTHTFLGPIMYRKHGRKGNISNQFIPSIKPVLKKHLTNP